MSERMPTAGRGGGAHPPTSGRGGGPAPWYPYPPNPYGMSQQQHHPYHSYPPPNPYGHPSYSYPPYPYGVGPPAGAPYASPPPYAGAPRPSYPYNSNNNNNNSTPAVATTTATHKAAASRKQPTTTPSKAETVKSGVAVAKPIKREPLEDDEEEGEEEDDDDEKQQETGSKKKQGRPRGSLDKKPRQRRSRDHNSATKERERPYFRRRTYKSPEEEAWYAFPDKLMKLMIYAEKHKESGLMSDDTACVEWAETSYLGGRVREEGILVRNATHFTHKILPQFFTDADDIPSFQAFCDIMEYYGFEINRKMKRGRKNYPRDAAPEDGFQFTFVHPHFQKNSNTMTMPRNNKIMKKEKPKPAGVKQYVEKEETTTMLSKKERRRRQKEQEIIELDDDEEEEEENRYKKHQLQKEEEIKKREKLQIKKKQKPAPWAKLIPTNGNDPNLIGRRVAKFFETEIGNVMYVGKIIEFYPAAESDNAEPDCRVDLWRVKYTDGDEEDYEAAELAQCLYAWDQQTKTEEEKKADQQDEEVEEEENTTPTKQAVTNRRPRSSERLKKRRSSNVVAFEHEEEENKEEESEDDEEKQLLKRKKQRRSSQSERLSATVRVGAAVEQEDKPPPPPSEQGDTAKKRGRPRKHPEPETSKEEEQLALMKADVLRHIKLFKDYFPDEMPNNMFGQGSIPRTGGGVARDPAEALKELQASAAHAVAKSTLDKVAKKKALQPLAPRPPAVMPNYGMNIPQYLLQIPPHYLQSALEAQKRGGAAAGGQGQYPPYNPMMMSSAPPPYHHQMAFLQHK